MNLDFLKELGLEERNAGTSTGARAYESEADYVDSYSALFDVYFWNKRNREALELIDLVESNSSSANIVADKIARARREAKKAGVKVYKKPDPEKVVATLGNE